MNKHELGNIILINNIADNLTLSMPMYILTSKKTFSGGEDFSYGMQQAKRATIVGEVTGGGAHPTNPTAS